MVAQGGCPCCCVCMHAGTCYGPVCLPLPVTFLTCENTCIFVLQGFNPTEVGEMLAWGPDRLGHCCCLTPALRQQLLE